MLELCEAVKTWGQAKVHGVATTAFAAEVGTTDVEGENAAFVGDGNNEDQARGFHGQCWGPFVGDVKAPDGFAGDEPCFESIGLRVREELEDPDPFRRDDADVVGVTFLMGPGVAGTDRYEGVEFVGELDDLVEHGFAELLVVGMVEPLFVRFRILVVGGDREWCCGDG